MYYVQFPMLQANYFMRVLSQVDSLLEQNRKPVFLRSVSNWDQSALVAKHQLLASAVAQTRKPCTHASSYT